MKKQAKWETVMHTFAPVYDSRSRILILGSFPSVKSREQQFYYGHPQNRFWKVLAQVTGEQKIPDTIQEKQEFLLRQHIALWDVIASCEMIGSSDSSIRNVIPNDIEALVQQTQIAAIYCNGTKAYELFQKYCNGRKWNRQITVQKLPSTSPANAGWQINRLFTAWKVITEKG